MPSTHNLLQTSAFRTMATIMITWEASISFATWSYAMHWLLQQKMALKATIHGAKFSAVAMNSNMTHALQDIEDESFFKAINVVLFSGFPASKTL